VVKLDDVVDRVIARLQAEANGAAVPNIVRATIRELGLEVASNGDIYDPAPAPAKSWEAPPERYARYQGRGKRRR
jgi:hypothetical protein